MLDNKFSIVFFTLLVPRKVLKEKYQGELEPDEMFEDETEYESGDSVGGVLEQPSIYSPDHSKGWVNPKSTMKPSFPSRSRSSRKSSTLASINLFYVLFIAKVYIQILSLCSSVNWCILSYIHVNKNQSHDLHERRAFSGKVESLKRKIHDILYYFWKPPKSKKQVFMYT